MAEPNGNSVNSSRRLLWRGLKVLAAGLICYGTLISWLFWRKDVLIDMPISLSPGTVVTPTFVPNVEGHYALEIDLQSKAKLAISSCYVGENAAGILVRDPERCRTPAQNLGASWTLFDDKKEIVARGAAGADSAYLSSGSFDDQLALVQLHAGMSYFAKIKFAGADSRFTNARLRLDLSGMDFKGEVIIAQLGGLLSFVIIIVGFVMTAAGGLPLLFKRYRSIGP